MSYCAVRLHAGLRHAAERVGQGGSHTQGDMHMLAVVARVFLEI